MIPPSIVPPSPRSFAFPALVPIVKIPPQAPLTPDVTSINLPVVPPIPPVVNTGDVITAQHENIVTTSLSDLWTDLQAINAAMLTDPTTTLGDLVVRGSSGLTRLGAGGVSGSVLTLDTTAPLMMAWKQLNAASIGAVPVTRQVLAGAGMSGGGSLGADVTLNANVTSVFGRTGAVVLTAADISAGGGVPATRSVIAGAGLAGGGPLTADVTLTANVKSVNGQTGAVVLTTADTGGVPATRRVIAGSGLAGGGALSADVTLAAPVMGPSGASHNQGIVPDPGATAGATRYLREDATWAVPAGGGGGGLTDPTTTLGDLIVRGSAAVTRLGVGTNGQVLTADSTQTLGVKWATPASGGGGSQTPWTSDIDGASHMLSNASAIGIGVGANTARPLWVQVNDASITAPARMENKAAGGAGGFMVVNDQGSIGNVIMAGSTYANPAWRDCAVFYTQQAKDLLLGTGNTERMRITGAGLVGINTAAPNSQFQVKVLTNQNIGFGWDSGKSVAYVAVTNDAGNANSLLAFQASSFMFYNYSGTGFVGIGKTPAYALDVTGDVNITGTYRVNGVALATGGSQTPWTSNHDAAGYSLSGVTTINAGTVNTGAFTLTGNANGLIRSTFINVNTGASSRTDIQIGARWGGTGSDMYIGTSNNAYGVGESHYIDCQGGKLLVTANQIDLNAYVGIGLMNAPVKLFVAGVDQAPGTGLGSFIVSAPATNMQLRMGYSQSGAYGWISASDSSVFTPLVLQGSGGLTGVGTVPNSKLTVYGTSIAPTNTGGVFPALIGIMGDTQVQMDLGAFPANPYGAYIQVRHVTASGLAWPLALNPLGGFVGIGTSTPAGPLHVAAKGSIFGNAAGAVGSPAATDANIMVYNNSAASWAGIGAASDGSMWFRVGTSGAPAAFMVISPNQGMGLGGIAAPGYQLQLSLDSAAKPGTNTWTVASDRRLKRDIRPFTEGLETLLRLRPTAFTYNGEADMPDGMEGVGLIAQEAAEVIPACVRHTRGLIDGEETDVLALNTSDLQWMIVNALSQIDQRLRRANL